MKLDNNKYRLLIEGIKQEYIGMHPFAKCIDILGEEPCIKEDKFRNVIKKYFSITITSSMDEQYKQIKKYEIISKSEQKKWDFLLVPTSTLFAKNKFALRKKLLDKFSIRGIITLKKSFFGSHVMPTSIIILDEHDDNVWLTSARTTDDVIDILLDISQYKRMVYYTKKLDSENFMPEFYNVELKKVNEKLNKFDTKELKDIAEIILGKNVDQWDFEDKGIPYLRVRNVQNGKICNLDSYVRFDCAEKYGKQLLQEGDVLLSKNFGQHKVARVNEEDLPAIASNGFFIIRAYGVPEDYLYQYFTSETGKAILEKQLSSIEHGSVITTINKKDLMNLRVPIFDNETMVYIGNIEEANASEFINTTSANSRFLTNANKSNSINALSFEMSIYQQFLQNGWEINEVLRESRIHSIPLKENNKWVVDIVLMNKNTKLAIVEVKSELSLFTPDILMKLQYAIYNNDIPFVILATVGYFEIHGHDNMLIKKCTTAPTKEELLKLLESGKEKA